MSIVWSNEIPDGRTGTIEFRKEKGGGKIGRTAVRVWQLHVDDKSHDDQYILEYGTAATPDPIPTILDRHPTNSTLKCRNLSAAQESGNDGKFWQVTANYDNNISEEDEQDAQQEDPLQRAPKYRIEWGQYTKILERDIDGLPIQNTAGDKFDPPLEDEDSRLVVTVTRNESASAFNSIVGLAYDYKNTVNSDTFLGQPPGSWRMMPILTGDIQTENDISYYQVTYAFELKEPYEGLTASKVENYSQLQPWDRLILNIGYNALTIPDDKSSKYPLPNKEAVKLSEDGTVFYTGTNADNYFYRNFRTKRRRPFGIFNF